MLQRDAAVVREQQLVEGAQAVVASVDERRARGLAGIAVGLERRHDRIRVAGGKGARVFGDDVRLVELRVELQHRRPDRVVASQRPAAVVDAQFADPPVGFLVGDDQDRKADSRVLAVKVDDHLREAAMTRDDILDVFDRGLLPAQPRIRLGDVFLERPCTADTSAHRMLQLRLARKRPDQSIEIPESKPSKNGTVTSSRCHFS